MIRPPPGGGDTLQFYYKRPGIGSRGGVTRAARPEEGRLMWEGASADVFGI